MIDVPFSFTLDNNECSSNNGGCSPNGLSTCHNTPGSYYCSCASGYHLDTNDLTCIGQQQYDTTI